MLSALNNHDSNNTNLPKVAVASLGGTITMTPGDSGGITPTLNAADLLAQVPQLKEIAQLEAKTLLQIPGASLTFNDVIAAVDWAKAAIENGATGAVLIQGTDTLEETSYLAHLIWDRPEPLVFVGAMRGPAQPSADGPANLIAAVRVAADKEASGKGVLVVLDQTIHHACLVYKGHSTALNAFRSHNNQVMGHIVEDQVFISETPQPAATLTFSPDQKFPFVPIWHTFLGDDGTGLNRLLETNPAGLVIAAFGVGHVSFGLADAIEKAAKKIPVILCTRISEGGTMRNTYGFNGSEKDLQKRGAIVSGSLDLHKSRILLCTLLAAGSSKEQIEEQFAIRGRQS